MTAFNRLALKTAGVVARPADEIKGDGAPVAKPTRTAAIAFHEGNERMHNAEKRSAELEALLADAIANAQAREIDLTELHEVPSRRRLLSPEEYASLKQNLQQNRLFTPVTVTPNPVSGYDIVSGNNRVAIYNELGRGKILCVVLDLSESEAEVGAFYANLMAPELGDFERYLGFKARQVRTGKSQTEISSESGFSKSTVSRCFSYDKLPPEARTMLASHPTALSSSAAKQLGLATDAGRGDKVLEAVRRLIANPKKFTQTQAMAFVKEPVPGKTYTSRSIKDGKKILATINVRGNKVILDFKKLEVQDGWLDQFEALIGAAMSGLNKT